VSIPFYTYAHTSKKKKEKNFAHVIRVVVVTRRFVIVSNSMDGLSVASNSELR
jgi:hypothetical protein